MTQDSAKTSQPLTVMVLDDLAMWRELVKFILEHELGISPVVASSGREALEMLEARPVDVVISDINMPGMNGIQFMHQARTVFPRTKFVMMTADQVTCTLSKECVSRGALAVVSKDEIDPNLLKLLRDLPKTD